MTKILLFSLFSLRAFDNDSLTPPLINKAGNLLLDMFAQQYIGGERCGLALHYILFARASSLHHLLLCAVTNRNESLAKVIG